MEEILIHRLSEFINEVKTLSAEAHNLFNLDNDNLETAKVVSAKLKTVLSRFSSELYNYFNICKNPDADEISNFTTHQLQGEEILAELDTRLKSKCEQQTTLAKEIEPSTYSKLPDLNLPQFNGDLLNWHQFWDQFNSSINRRKLNDVDKLLYLKSSLKGEAARLIDGFNTTNKSYHIAVDTLKSRYGKEHEVIHAHHRALNNVKRAETFEDCRTTFDDLQRHLRVLQSIGENTDTNQMRFLVMEKFPADIIYDTKMRLGIHGIHTVESIMEHLSLIISTKEEAMRITQNHSKGEATETPYTVETLHVKDEANPERSGPAKFSYSHGSNHFKRQQSNFKFRRNWNSRDKGPVKGKFGQKKEMGNNNMDKRKRRWHCIFCKGNHLNINCDKVKSIRERKSKLQERCFNCFRMGHFRSQCRRKSKCEYCGKYGNHNQALCPNKFQEKAKEEKVATSVMHVSRKETVLQTAVIKVKGHGNIIKNCRILLDTGSGRSYITERMAKDLKLQAEEQNNLAIFTFGSQNPREIRSTLVKLGIITKNNTVKTLYVNVVPTISQGVPYPKENLYSWKNERNYQLADDGSLSNRIDMLLGNDYYYTIMSTNKIQIGDDLYLVDSELGWILSGIISIKPIEQMSVLTYFQNSSEIGLNQPDLPLDNGNIKRLWDLESIGITDSPKTTRNEEAIEHFNETTEYTDKRYYVSWPWSDNPTNLPTNFGLAYGRLVTLLKRLDLETLRIYDETLKEQIVQGIVEEVPNKRVDHAVHYIAHHSVSAPGKSLRIVYDGSAKVKDNKSLNEHLYCGPLLLEDLTGMLIKFRCHAIGITADVEKAFLQIGLKQQDRDVTRFLWLRDLQKPAMEDNLVHLRFTRVPFGLTSSPFILNATVKHHLSKSKNENVHKASNDIYVDNLVTGTNSIQEALELYHDLKNTFNEISMNLREWSSNSKNFMDCIPDACSDKTVKLLGLDWNLEDDTISLRAKVKENNYTKRGILKTIAAVYDPCGFSVPIMLAAKILLQDLWKTKVKWDTALDNETVVRWRTILRDMKDIEDVRLPRRTANIYGKRAELHCFTDSSMQAYAAVIYLVQEDTVNFLIGKSRLVPIKDHKNLKIPRLELLGVLIGSRLIKYVLKFLQLNITRQILWTDSQIVIDWYNSDKLLTPFVARRLDEIKQNKDLLIRHVPSGLNPADVATRPSAFREERLRWLLGPEFLKKEQVEWPTGPARTVSLLAREGLLNSEYLQTDLKLGEEIKVNKILNEQIKESPDNILKEMKLEDNVIKEIKNVQSKYFKDEVNGKETSLSRNLGLFKDVDGILRCKGRLKYAEWSFDKRYPVIIPKDCEFTNKIIINTHEKNYHVGVNHTLSIIRERYWIPQGKIQVSKILRKCVRCVKHGGGPFKLPSTPALPHERVNYSKPFTFTGIDYLGPVLVKTEKGSSKRWICLFTCLAVRAIHLEIVEDLSADEGLLALRRMISTRGVPTLITSDNALHFKLIADIVAKAYCVENKIKWRFIPELAPWHGGFYERLVGLVKHCMRRTFQKHLLRDSQLLTVMKEIEAVLNTRPLTCVDTELEHILKPSDFLQPGRCVTLETADSDVLQGTSTKTNLIMGWRKTRVILDEFKEMFQNRYLPSLRERYSHLHKQPRVISKLTPKEGQIVQIKGDKNREGWKVGKIVSLIKGSDNAVRVARVRVGNNLFTRSIAHLYPLEIDDALPLDSITSRGVIESGQLPEESLKEVDVSPLVNAEQDLIQKETIIDRVKGGDNVKVTREENDIEMESADKVESDDLRYHVNDTLDNELDMDVDSTNGIDSMKGNQMSTEEDRPNDEMRHKRIAAVRALERIREWTQNLMTLL